MTHPQERTYAAPVQYSIGKTPRGTHAMTITFEGEPLGFVTTAGRLEVPLPGGIVAGPQPDGPVTADCVLEDRAGDTFPGTLVVAEGATAITVQLGRPGQVDVRPIEGSITFDLEP